MSARIKLFFLSFVLLSQLIFPPFALASHNCSQADLDATVNPTSASQVIQLHQLECVFSSTIGVVAALAGIAALLVIIYGGFKYMAAQGDQKALASARSTITLAVAGLIMVLIAYFIISVISGFTSLPDLRKLIIPRP